MPPWPGCAPGTGTVEIPSESTPITLSLDGDVCVAIAAPGYVIFKGFLEIVPFPKKPGGRAELTGLGNFDLRLLTDGTLTYYVEGWFTKARH